MADRHRVRLAYWASFGRYLKEKRSSFQVRTPTKDHWKWFAIGRAGFGINATMSTEKRRVGVELSISDDPSKVAFRALLAQKEEIEAEFGESLEWQELPGRKSSRVAVFKLGVDPTQEEQYSDLHRWMLEKMDRFRAVFASRVRALSLILPLDAPDEEHPEE
jgi:hypothetical protein